MLHFSLIPKNIQVFSTEADPGFPRRGANSKDWGANLWFLVNFAQRWEEGTRPWWPPPIRQCPSSAILKFKDPLRESVFKGTTVAESQIKFQNTRVHLSDSVLTLSLVCCYGHYVIPGIFLLRRKVCRLIWNICWIRFSGYVIPVTNEAQHYFLLYSIWTLIECPLVHNGLLQYFPDPTARTKLFTEMAVLKCASALYMYHSYQLASWNTLGNGPNV